MRVVGILSVIALAAISLSALFLTSEKSEISVKDYQKNGAHKQSPGLLMAPESKRKTQVTEGDTLIIDPSEIYENAAPKGVLSIYPILPHDQYNEHIARAVDGNSNSQYMVARAIFECLRVPNKEYAAELKSRFYNDVELWKKLESDAEYCEELFSLIPPQDIEEAYNTWMSKALKNGHKMALAFHWFENIHSFPRDKAREILENAIYSSDPAIFILISAYYSAYVSEQRDTANTEKAWQLVHCDKSSSCNTEKLYNHMRQNSFEYEFEEIDKKYHDIVGALNNGEAVALK